jgi:hypothetical protein
MTPTELAAYALETKLLWGKEGAEYGVIARTVLDAIGYDALVAERDHWIKKEGRLREAAVRVLEGRGNDAWSASGPSLLRAALLPQIDPNAPT